MIKITLTSLIILFAFSSSFSQIKSLSGTQANSLVANSSKIGVYENTSIPVYIELKEDSQFPLSYLSKWLLKTFKVPQNIIYKQISQEADNLGFIHYRYQQICDNITIDDAIFIVHTKNNKVVSINGNIKNNISYPKNKAFTKSAALNKALEHVNASVYKWNIPSEEKYLKQLNNDENATYYPNGEEVLLPVSNNIGETSYKLAYKYNIYAQKPLKRSYVFVDASNGEIIKELAIIHNADVDATAQTAFSGQRQIKTNYTSGEYRLYETNRGGGIYTYDMNNQEDYNAAVLFADADNNWSADTKYGTECHWSMEKTYDYYFEKYNRNSLNNAGLALRSYVHYGDSYQNAFWDGQKMTFGDDQGNLNPYTTIDIVAHELTHGITSYTANLNYISESGALNEAFSDIFACVIENYARPENSNWEIGEDRGYAMRSMTDPNAYNLPDTYKGNYWYTGLDDNGGVHINMGVLSYWFYLISNGGSGTNDYNKTYNVTGIGTNNAAKIAYRMLTVYLNSYSQYQDALFYGIQSAIDLYGACSPEVESVTNAFYAVGLGNAYIDEVKADFTADFTKFCAAPSNVTFRNNSSNGLTFSWDFGDGATSTSISPMHTYNSDGTYDVKLIIDGGSCGKDTLTKTAFIDINENNDCITILSNNGQTATQTNCYGTLYDNGGVLNYTDETYSYITIAPDNADSVTIVFDEFAYETDFDFLKIFDGPDTLSTLIGDYSGFELPNGGTITSSGNAITLRHKSDTYVNYGGFKLNWYCHIPNDIPKANFIFSSDISCSGLIDFTDKSFNTPNKWEWDFGDGKTDTVQNPTHLYEINGYYDVKLIAYNDNGSDTTIKENCILINKPQGPIAYNGSSCGVGQVTLTATGNGIFEWYDTIAGGIPLFVGSSYTTPFLNDNKKYYVQLNEESTTLFLPPYNNTIGNGAYYTNTALHYLKFNVEEELNLVSVKVYANSSGYREIQLQTFAGAVLESKNVSIPLGESRVNLNFVIKPGNYRLSCNTTAPGLYRNSTGAGFPRKIDGLISITGSSASDTNFYYYFYDWEVVKIACISERTEVDAIITNQEPIADFTYSGEYQIGFTSTSTNEDSYLWDFGDGNISTEKNPTYDYSENGFYDVKLVVENDCGKDSITKNIQITTLGMNNIISNNNIEVYPNPTTGNLYVKYKNNESCNIRLFNSLGKLVYSNYFRNEKTLNLNMSDLSKGIYYLIVTDKNNIYKEKVVLQ